MNLLCHHHTTLFQKLRIAQIETLPVYGNLVVKPICSFSSTLGSILGHTDIKNPWNPHKYWVSGILVLFPLHRGRGLRGDVVKSFYSINPSAFIRKMSTCFSHPGWFSISAISFPNNLFPARLSRMANILIRALSEEILLRIGWLRYVFNASANSLSVYF